MEDDLELLDRDLPGEVLGSGLRYFGFPAAAGEDVLGLGFARLGDLDPFIVGMWPVPVGHALAARA
jgi:hypothetical protein